MWMIINVLQALHPESAIRKSEQWQWRHNLLTWRHHQFFFDVVLFLLSSVVGVSSFMSISLLVLELWQFSFTKDWPEIRKSAIPPSRFCPLSENWGELGIPNLARMFLIKCYYMMQNAKVKAFTVIEILRETQQRVATPNQIINIINKAINK